MDFNDAIKAHSIWKQKLAAYICKPDRSLKSSEACSDRNCELGKWIYGEGSRHSQMPEYARMKEAHTAFHAAAADVITKADHGQDMTEETALGGNSRYASASTAVVSAIMAMKANAKQ